MAAQPALETYLAGLDPETRAAMDALRGVVQGARADLVEEVKWNAPSFSHRGEDRVTLGVERHGGLRLVLHRGAKIRDAEGFSFRDETGLARWPSSDRGVVLFRDMADVEAKSETLGALVSRWIDATAGP